MNNNNGQLA